MDAPAPEPLHVHIRRRPGMYVGGTGSPALRAMLDDIVIEQLTAPGARPQRVRCVLGADGTHTIEVSGGDVAAVEPADVTPGAYDDGSKSAADPFFSLAIACALSERLEAAVVRGGRAWSQSFAAGVPVAPPRTDVSADPPSVRVRYRPDPAVFADGASAEFGAVCGRALEWAAFHPHVRFTVDDQRDRQCRDYHCPQGLLSLAQELEHEWFGWDSRTGRDRAAGAWRCEATAADGAAAEAVFVPVPTGSRVYSYVNGRRTLGGGTHVDAFRRAVAEVAASCADDPNSPFPDPRVRDPLDTLSGGEVGPRLQAGRIIPRRPRQRRVRGRPRRLRHSPRRPRPPKLGAAGVGDPDPGRGVTGGAGSFTKWNTREG